MDLNQFKVITEIMDSDCLSLAQRKVIAKILEEQNEDQIADMYRIIAETEREK